MKIFLQALCLFLISCSTRDDTVYIKGNIKGTNLKKVFLANAFYWNKFLDSSDIVNGYFEFKWPAIDSNNLYSIKYLDDTGRIFSLELINRVLSSDSQKYFIDAFIIDTNKISIYGDLAKYNNHYYEITAGSETRALYKTQMMQFGYLDPEKSKRSSQLNDYIKIIAEYPNSNYLLTQLNTNKSTVTKKELQQMLSKFSTKALESYIGKSLSKYTLNKKEDIYFDNVLLNNHHGNKINLLDSSAKINMLVFWASWCGPCRQEIPMLKELYTKYKGKGLSITSVSIDEKKDDWLKAVAIDKVPWSQLIIPIQNMETFKNN